MRCAIITSRSFLSTPLPDDLLLKMALEARGVEVRLQAWEERPPTEASDVAIIRSAWNAHLFPDAYLRWAKKTAEKSLILNPFKVVQWNMHKALYFRDLAFLGIPLIPTIVLRPEKHRLAKLMQQLSWPEIILKPRCGANSYAVQKITQENLVQGQACLDQSREDFLMQPYLASIHSSGENCHCFLGGRRLCKGRFFHSAYEQEKGHGILEIHQKNRIERKPCHINKDYRSGRSCCQVSSQR